MRNAIVFLGALFFISFAAASEKPTEAEIEHGKYLVTQVGICQDCHTPRNEKGEFIKQQWLGGAPILFKPTVAMPAWADKSPRIAGLPGWDRDGAIKFFMTGETPDGFPVRPPMPEFRFNRRDAEAVVAYLLSLGPAR